MRINVCILLFSSSLLLFAACGGDPGAAGAVGPKGASGLNGVDGQTGAGGETIASGIGCAKVDAGSGVSALLVYESIIYSTGDRFVSGSVSGNSLQSSGTEMFKSTQAGALSGGVTVVADIDAASSGAWTFTSQAGVTKAVYNDVTSAHNLYTYTFAAGDCTVF